MENNDSAKNEFIDSTVNYAELNCDEIVSDDEASQYLDEFEMFCEMDSAIANMTLKEYAYCELNDINFEDFLLKKYGAVSMLREPSDTNKIRDFFFTILSYPLLVVLKCPWILLIIIVFFILRSQLSKLIMELINSYIQ